MDKREVKWMKEDIIPCLESMGFLIQTNEQNGSTGIPDILAIKQNIYFFIELKVKGLNDWRIFEPSQFAWRVRHIASGNRNLFTIIKSPEAESKYCLLCHANSGSEAFLRTMPNVATLRDSVDGSEDNGNITVGIYGDYHDALHDCFEIARAFTRGEL